MKILWAILITSVSFSTANASIVYQNVDNLGVTHVLETVPVSAEGLKTLSELELQLVPGSRPFPIDPEDPMVIINEIINIGKKLWEVIAANKPVVNVQFQYANALPRGIKSSEELDGFSSLQAKGLRAYAKNPFGVTVYDVNYLAVHRYAGNFEGRGQYLENVTILPQTLEVAWGYTVNLSVDKISAINVGTKEKPVGSILMQTSLKVDTVMKHGEYREVFEFRGDNKDVRLVSSN